MGKTRRRPTPTHKASGFTNDLPEQEVHDPLMNSMRPRMVRKHSRGRQRVILVAGILLLAMLAVMSFSVQDNTSSDNIGDWLQSIFTRGSETDFPISISGASVKSCNIEWNGSTLSVFSDTSFSTYGGTGKITLQRPHSYNTPRMCIEGSYSLLYNLRGTDFVLQSRTKTIRTGTTDYPIYAATVSKNGYYALTTTESGQLSGTIVYDKYGTQLIRIPSTEYSVIDIDISPDETEVALLGVTTDGGHIQSSVYIYRLSEEEPEKYKYPDTLLYNLRYMDTSTIAIIGETFVGVIQRNSGDTVRYEFGRSTLTSWSINPDSGINIALTDYLIADSTKVTYLDKQVQEQYAFTVQGKVLSVDNDKNRTAVLTEGKLLCFSDKGDLIYEADRRPGDQSIRFRKNSIFLIGLSQISRTIIN